MVEDAGGIVIVDIGWKFVTGVAGMPTEAVWVAVTVEIYVVEC
jgi:hypothetical protein